MSLNPVGRKKGMPLPLKAVSAGVHHELDRQEEDNTGLEAAHSTQKSASSTLRFLRQQRDRTRQMKARRSTPAREAKESTEAVESGSNASRAAGAVKPSADHDGESTPLQQPLPPDAGSRRRPFGNACCCPQAGSQPSAGVYPGGQGKIQGTVKPSFAGKTLSLTGGGLFATCCCWYE